jgi:N-acetyl-gamma-glutamyl-phosphate reductase
MATQGKTKVAILGASGYSGIETVRLLASHPRIELTLLTSENYAGRAVAQVHRHLAGLELPAFEPMNPEAVMERAQVALSCLPERVGAKVIAELLERGLRVIDFSADYRLKQPADYTATYGVAHPAPALLAQAVYGLTEFHRAEIARARLIANPGCYPTGTLLGALPLLQQGLVDPASLLIDAKSGTTGARRAAALDQLFAEVNESLRPYRVGNHRHVPEMEQEIARTVGGEIAILFVPHLLPVNRGILSSIFMRPRLGVTAADIQAAFESCYAGSPFVRILGEGEMPELRNVRATNRCEIAFVLAPRAQALVVITAIDNLGKGAAGQAIQNLNAMLGIDEATGLCSYAPVP